MSLVLHVSGDAIEDKSIYHRMISNSGVTVSTSVHRDGKTSSLYFNGSSNLLIDNVKEMQLTGDFAVEWWEYSTSSSNGTRFCTQYTGSNYGGILCFYRGTALYVGQTVSSGWNVFGGSTAADVVSNTWVHRRFQRVGSNWYSYKNGSLFWSGTSSTILTTNTTYKFSIGDYRTGDHDYWTGYIDDFKVYNDTIKPEIYYRPADSWKQVSSLYMKDNGAWKQADSIVVKQDNWKISG